MAITFTLRVSVVHGAVACLVMVTLHPHADHRILLMHRTHVLLELLQTLDATQEAQVVGAPGLQPQNTITNPSRDDEVRTQLSDGIHDKGENEPNNAGKEAKMSQCGEKHAATTACSLSILKQTKYFKKLVKDK